MNSRINREVMNLQIARLLGQRTTCPRARGGTVITVRNRIISTGYAGAPAGLPHCTDVGCLLGPDGGCQRTVHAEISAITFAARWGVSVEGGVLYTTLCPCEGCAKAIINSGIVVVIYEELYRKVEGLELLKQAGVILRQVSLPETTLHATPSELIQLMTTATP